jgi:hypothetical protein
MLIETILHLDRRDVLPASDDEVPTPAGEVHESVAVRTEITGVVPAVDDCLFCKIGTVIVALKKAIAFDQNLADAAISENDARIRGDADFMTGQQ